MTNMAHDDDDGHGGDVNIDILKHELNKGTKFFLDTMYSVGLHPLVDRQTRISNHSSSLFTNRQYFHKCN